MLLNTLQSVPNSLFILRFVDAFAWNGICIPT
jgi:hypothetical protein